MATSRSSGSSGSRGGRTSANARDLQSGHKREAWGWFSGPGGLQTADRYHLGERGGTGLGEAIRSHTPHNRSFRYSVERRGTPAAKAMTWLGGISNTAVVLGVRDCYPDQDNQDERQVPEDVV
jgi:hypothetical protein